jgi:phosphonate degradation associated HDIG domain protein
MLAPMTAAPATLDELLDRFDRRGEECYGGEPVTLREHALQCAERAQAEGAPRSLVVAALLHDLGHVVHELGEDCTERGVDDAHEVRAVRALSGIFGPAVLEPIRLHVQAKRYLVAVDPLYADGLSAASARSLVLQGGPMDDAEQAAFRALPNSSEALLLRHWDELAKVPGRLSAISWAAACELCREEAASPR